MKYQLQMELLEFSFSLFFLSFQSNFWKLWEKQMEFSINWFFQTTYKIIEI